MGMGNLASRLLNITFYKRIFFPKYDYDKNS